MVRVLNQVRTKGRHRTRALQVAGAVVLIMASTVAQAVDLGTFRVGNWTGFVYSNEGTEASAHCAGTAPYANGTSLVFDVGRDRSWSFGLTNDDWSFVEGQTYEIDYWIDTSAPTTTNAVALSQSQVKIALTSDSETFLRFRRGATLKVTINGETLSFKLTQTDKLIKTLISCAETNGASVKAETASAPNAVFDGLNSVDNTGSVGGTAPFIRDVARVTPTPLERVEATAELANLLAAADIHGFEIVPDDLAPDAFRRHDAIWRNDQITGSLRIIADDEVEDLSIVRASLIATDARNCTGRFASGAVSDLATSELSTMNMFTACENGESEWSAYYSTHARGEGGYYLLTLVGSPEASETVKTVGAQLQDIASTPRHSTLFQTFE